jgi:hypothetical protein
VATGCDWNPEISLVELDPSGSVALARLEDYRADCERTDPREPGLHCSQIVNDMLRTAYPSKYGRPEAYAGQRIAYQEIGNVIEDVLGEGLRRRLFRFEKPKPRRHLGVWCSPDGWDARTRTIHEIKATWVSARDFANSVKCMGYVWQGLRYVDAWDARRLRLHVVFLNGDYKPPSPWLPREFAVWFTRATIEMNTRTQQQHAQDRGWL